MPQFLVSVRDPITRKAGFAVRWSSTWTVDSRWGYATVFPNRTEALEAAEAFGKRWEPKVILAGGRTCKEARRR